MTNRFPADDYLNYEGDANEIQENSDKSDLQGEAQHRSLYIGNLSRYCQQKDLETFLVGYEVIEIDLRMRGGRSIGYGFVKFPSYEAALSCKTECDGKLINGRRVTLSWAQRNTRLIITNFSLYITVHHIHELLKKYGAINESSTLIQPGDGKASVIVEFEQRGSAEKAKQDINSKRVDSSGPRADWYCGSPSDSLDDGIVSVYFKYESHEVDKLVDEVCISKVFSAFGHVLDVSIKGSFAKPEEFGQAASVEGFGFVDFENNTDGKAAAIAAAESLKGFVFEGVKFTAEPSKNLIRSMQKEGIDIMPSSGVNLFEEPEPPKVIAPKPRKGRGHGDHHDANLVDLTQRSHERISRYSHLGYNGSYLVPPPRGIAKVYGSELPVENQGGYGNNARSMPHQPIYPYIPAPTPYNARLITPSVPRVAADHNASRERVYGNSTTSVIPRDVLTHVPVPKPDISPDDLFFLHENVRVASPDLGASTLTRCDDQKQSTPPGTFLASFPTQNNMTSVEHLIHSKEDLQTLSNFRRFPAY